MTNPKKRIQALAELYESEKSYLIDLCLWEDLFRNKLSQIANKYTVVDSILNDVVEIKDLHMRIFLKMKHCNDRLIFSDTNDDDFNNQGRDESENDVLHESDPVHESETMMHKSDPVHKSNPVHKKDVLNKCDETVLVGFPDKIKEINNDSLEYYSSFEPLISDFEPYVKYIQHLPRAEYEFDKIMATDLAFKTIVLSFLQSNHLLNLGMRHFFYRPSVKISRYPILFKAIAKNEKDPEGYKRAMRRTDEIAKSIDSIYRERSSLFDTFILSNRMVYGNHVRDRFSLGLIYKRAKLIKDGKLITKKGKLEPASYKHVFVFNRMILICRTIEGPYQNIIIDDEPIFLCKVYLLKNLDGFTIEENLEGLYPLFLLQKEHCNNKNRIKALYFEDENTRDLYYYKICRAIHEINKDMRDNVGLRKVEDTRGGLRYYFRPENSIGNFLCNSREEQHFTSNNREDSGLSSGGLSGDSGLTSEDSGLTSEDSGLGSKDSCLGESSPDLISGEQADLASGEPSSSSSSPSGLGESNYDGEKERVFNFDKFGVDSDSSSDSSSDCSFRSYTYSEIYSDESTEDTEISSLSDESVEESARPRNICFDLFRRSALPLVDLTIHNEFNMERTRNNRRMNIYSTREGVFREYLGNVTKVSELPASKIFYDPEYELLLFLCNEKLYLGQFHCNSENVDFETVNASVKNFFYGKFENTAYIALISIEEFTFSIIHLLSVVFNRNKPVLDITVLRKLYVGFTIFNVFFLKGRIIISCKDFEIIEIDTLRTQELLEIYDSTLSLLLEEKQSFIANSLFKLDGNTYLLCFSGGGYIVDKTGRLRENNVSYNWEMIGEEFEVFEDWIIVVGRSYVGVFEIETGKMVKMEYKPGMKIVRGAKRPLLYNKRGIYEIIHTSHNKVLGVNSKVGIDKIGGSKMSTNNNLTSNEITNNKSTSNRMTNTNSINSEVFDKILNLSFSTSSFSTSSGNIWESVTIEDEKYNGNNTGWESYSLNTSSTPINNNNSSKAIGNICNDRKSIYNSGKDIGNIWDSYSLNNNTGNISNVSSTNLKNHTASYVNNKEFLRKFRKSKMKRIFNTWKRRQNKTSEDDILTEYE